MKMLKTFACLLLVTTVTAAAVAKDKKSGRRKAVVETAAKDTTVDSLRNNSRKPYESVITPDAETVRGLVILHKVKSKYYMELPYSVMDAQMLLAARVSGISNNRDIIAGRMPHDPLLIRWSADDDKVYLHTVDCSAVCDSAESIAPGFERNKIDPVMQAFPIAAVSPDSSAVVIEVGSFFAPDQKPFRPFLDASPLAKLFGLRESMQGKFQKEMSGVVSMQAFPENVNFRTRMVYTVYDHPFTAEMTVSMIRLPETPMRPRYGSPRIGLFNSRKVKYSTDKDYLETVRYLERWNIAPRDEDLEKYKRGELVEPAKQIVYYVDPAFPDKWRPYIKAGIEDWQKAFEAIGFKNAIVARDYPDDPQFNPDDIRNTCIVYSSTNVANAMGPSWTDPRSGEILQASVYFFHNVIELVHNWRFVQTAAVDPKARAEVYDTETMGPMLRYVIAHEVGHTLGLMHNMRGSYAYPVDSLRSPSFTEKYGTTASIMDYARNNYVAQPGDGVTQLLPPHLGLYDYYAIKWAYQPIFEAKTPEEEVPVLNRWIDEKADDPIYIYGEQAIFGATDPASQTESLGDDAMKATEYGIRNLKIVVDSLHLWTAYPGKDYNRTEKLYEEVFKQARRYLGHVMVYLGGSYRYYPMVGSDQPAFEMVSKQKQKEALNFIFDKLYELPDWYVNPQLEKLTRPKNEDVTDYQMSTVRTLLLPGRIARMETNAKLTPEDAYSASEYVDDIYNRVWASTLKNKPLSHSERMMQYAFVQSMLRGIDALDKESSLRGLTDYPAEDEGAFWPCRHIECGRHGNGFEDQMTGSTRATDVQLYATSLCYNQLRKLGKLLRARVQSSTDELAEHYRYLNYEIEKALEKGL